ncbi:uncharacterized protein LOC130670049 isoform X2 [Microplitis mediator]|uniref:uncharacterized protein LOC130670049 isoform X2 n=1 Tax=Microplitis mediator TaxID=375433 RepID=UPI002553838E|nr:uncharacterized protein LOC130670049 isoform X2 [Microplitis mediator]
MGFKYLVLILLNVCVSLAKFPELSVDAEEIHLLENESLELICNGSNPKFIFPRNITMSEIPTSSVEIIEDRERGSVLLKRNKTVYGDTGWYGCVDSYDFPSNPSIENENITPDNFHKIDARWANISVKWTYVYVKSSEHVLVEPWNTIENIRINEGDDTVLSCRPTSSNYTVTLLLDGQKINLNSRVSFDPRRGISLRNVTRKDSGIIPQRPVLSGYSRERLIVDKELTINCSIIIPRDIAFTLKWKTPKSNQTNFGRSIMEVIGDGLIRHTNKLTIQNFTHDEEGIYECIHKTLSGYNSTSINITLADAKLRLKIQRLTRLERNRKNYNNSYPVPVFVRSNCSNQAELSPAAVESLKDSIINEIKRNLTDIISNAVKESFNKYLTSARKNENSKN